MLRAVTVLGARHPRVDDDEPASGLRRCFGQQFAGFPTEGTDLDKIAWIVGGGPASEVVQALTLEAAAEEVHVFAVLVELALLIQEEKRFQTLGQLRLGHGVSRGHLTAQDAQELPGGFSWVSQRVGDRGAVFHALLK